MGFIFLGLFLRHPGASKVVIQIPERAAEAKGQQYGL
jgi:hypothetical protein